ncbi:MAG: dihydroorotase [Rhizobiales bacterium 65-9]|nr:dihydroorotase [Hyphomicrobiales bacterium]OJY34010.1 MAG: dihydroorotase [Rhizobiales bacterium 65-9]
MPQTDPRPLLLVDARLVDPSTGRDERGGLLIDNGVIREVGPSVVASSAPNGAEIVDCRGVVVAPGLIDMQAFAGEPGAEHRETMRTISQAAAAGGVTSVACLPNTDPPVDGPAIVDFLLRRARDRSIVRIYPLAALTKGRLGEEMTEIGLLKEAGAVAFTDGPQAIVNAQVMRRILVYAQETNALVVHHVEDPKLVGDGVMNEGEFCSRLGLAGIPREAETIMLERDIRLVRLTGGRYHAAIVSCAASLDVIRRAKADGLQVTCGTSINHLTLNENDVGQYRSFCKVAPPLRHEDDRLACVDALEDGTIDVVVSDHNPQDVETKRLPFAECADGAIGVETMLSAGLRLVHDGQVSLNRLMHAMSTKPAELLGVPGGSLKPGLPGDVILLDADLPWVVDRADLKSRSKNSPFDEARLTGRVVKTIVAGRVVYDYR